MEPAGASRPGGDVDVAFTVRCGQLCTPALMEPLARVARALEKYADQLAAAS